MSATVKVPGVRVTFAGETTLIVPPLSLNAMQQLHERIRSFQGGTTPEDVATVVDAAHAALRRNYPNMTREEVGELVDLGNMLEVMEAVMDVSGLKRKAQQAEDQKPGEAPAP